MMNLLRECILSPVISSEEEYTTSLTIVSGSGSGSGTGFGTGTL